jgi:hypothetical protein
LAWGLVILAGCGRNPPPPGHDLRLLLHGDADANTRIAVAVGHAEIPLGIVGVPDRVTGVDATSITATLFPDDDDLCLVEYRDLFADASHACTHQFFALVRLSRPRAPLLAGDWLLAASGDAAGARTITRPDGAQVPLALSFAGTCQIIHRTGAIGLVRGAEVRAQRPDEPDRPPVVIDQYRLISWYRIGDDACHHDSSSFVHLPAAPDQDAESPATIAARHPWLTLGRPVAHDPAWFLVTAEPPLHGDHPCVDAAPVP